MSFVRYVVLSLVSYVVRYVFLCWCSFVSSIFMYGVPRSFSPGVCLSFFMQFVRYFFMPLFRYLFISLVRDVSLDLFMYVLLYCVSSLLVSSLVIDTCVSSLCMYLLFVSFMYAFMVVSYLCMQLFLSLMRSYFMFLCIVYFFSQLCMSFFRVVQLFRSLCIDVFIYGLVSFVMYVFRQFVMSSVGDFFISLCMYFDSYVFRDFVLQLFRSSLMYVFIVYVGVYLFLSFASSILMYVYRQLCISLFMYVCLSLVRYLFMCSVRYLCLVFCLYLVHQVFLSSFCIPLCMHVLLQLVMGSLVPYVFRYLCIPLFVFSSLYVLCTCLQLAWCYSLFHVVVSFLMYICMYCPRPFVYFVPSTVMYVCPQLFREGFMYLFRSFVRYSFFVINVCRQFVISLLLVMCVPLFVRQFVICSVLCFFSQFYMSISCIGFFLYVCSVSLFVQVFLQ